MNQKVIVGLIAVTVIVIVASIEAPYLTFAWVGGFYGCFAIGFLPEILNK